MSGARPVVLFDLDGTLVDSAADIASACDAALADLGLPPRGFDTVKGFIGQGSERLMHRCLTGARDGIAPPALFAPAYARFEAHYETNLLAHTRPYPGAVETLDRLAAAGYALGLVTNKPSRFTLPLLAGLDLARHFLLVRTGDRLPRKPDPAPLLDSAAALGGVPASTTLVGDSAADIDAARAAGMRILCVSFGYAQPGDLVRLAPDAVVDTLPALLALFAV